MKSRALAVIMVAAIALTAGAQQPAPQPPAGQAISPGTLDQLLAPIALYPDALVVQILSCAQSPYQVRQVDTWLKQQADLKGSALQQAAQQQGFDPSFVAIVLFPQVLDMMAGKIDWTTQLGQAFTSDRKGVFDSIQRLRAEAQAVGNLKSTPQQEVQTQTTSSGQQVIVIQPANPQVVYVPEYNPQVVYVQPAPSTVVVQDNSSAVAAGLIGFTAGVIVGAAASDDYWGWHGGSCYEEGWDDFYQHRENMANDWYDHREDMASQHSDNVSERQDGRTDRQSDRQDASSDRQTDRQDSQSDRQSDRQQGASDRQGSRQDAAGAAQQGGYQRSGGSEARGRSGGMDQGSGDRTGMHSSAFSGFQGGANERAASSRGSSSLSSARGGGGRQGGGRRR